MNESPRTVSIIINTDGRADSLKVTLNSLRYLNYPVFEVCVVYGPTLDGTRELLNAKAAELKVAHCPVRNLSVSRNIGMAMASGEILAFLDDDSIPEPEWLGIVKQFDDPEVGASGGFLYDHTGVDFQWRFGTANRLGRADKSWDRPTPEFNFPFSSNFPHLMANSAFRKSAVLDVGGFDEHYEYFLDETDVICRLVDRGWRIAQVAGACVHHKFKASHIRKQGIFQSWYAIVRSKIYYSLINTHGHHGILTAITDAQELINNFKSNLDSAISTGLASDEDRKKFCREVDLAWRDGLMLGFANRRQLMDREALRRFEGPFLPFQNLQPPSKRRTFCLLSQTYPPGSIGGIGRYVHQLARSMAAFGHQIHVLTRASDRDVVDFEDGVWVHRMRQQPNSAPKGLTVPKHIWDYSAAMLAEVKRISESRTVDAVYAPIWDCEGIAFILDGKYPLVTGLQTTLHFWLKSEKHRMSEPQFMVSFAQPMLALEKLILENSAGVHAISAAIAHEIETAYEVQFHANRIAVIPLGQEDWSAFPLKEPDARAEGTLRVLFVGRLEERKGIDVLLGVLKRIMPLYPAVQVDIVGNDSLAGPGNVTYRAAFEIDKDAQSFRDRVRFHGEVDDERLRGFYRACDIFVAPSRFESFGLILSEAMMFGKPVIACRAGGMVEIVDDGVTGLLAEPGNLTSLETCLVRLIEDQQLRCKIGALARQRYERLFTPERMAKQLIEFLSSIADRPTDLLRPSQRFVANLH
jgi:glycogen synthase